MSIILWKDLQKITDVVCKKFNLKYNSLIPETRNRAFFFGACISTSKGKNICLRIHQKGKPRKPLAKSTILHTLSHELAHLKYWKHGKDHNKFQKEILRFIKDKGFGD